MTYNNKTNLFILFSVSNNCFNDVLLFDGVVYWKDIKVICDLHDSI